MDSTPKLLGFLLMLWITASAKALPKFSSNNEVSSSKNIVGIASQIITNALIQGQADSSSNYVFSPLGYATILSILGQGSIGQTRNEIYHILGQPDNADEVRSAYRLTLTEYSGNDSVIAPQFKTWFYIYRNNTAEEDFKKILTDDYLVEIKDIDRFSYDFDSPRTSEQNSEAVLQKLPTNSKDVIQFEDLKNTEPKDEFGVIDGFETLKIVDENPPSVQQALSDYEQLNEDEKNKVSKFDKHIDEDQYIDVNTKDKKGSKGDDVDKKLHKKSEGPEKISLPLKKYMENSAEVMEAQESRHFINRLGESRAQPLHFDGDVTSALSGNSIVGRKDADSPKAENQLESKMLLFNGLYFRGNWKFPLKPFMELRSDDKQYFNGVNGKQDVKFMMTHGSFKFTEIRSKNLVAVELPYENERYSMVIIVTDTKEDLGEFSKESNYNSLNDIFSRMEPTYLQLFVPKFRFECTSRAEKALGKLGLTTLFTSKADLRGITKDAQNYQIEELVQHVAIRIDEGSSSESALSAGNLAGNIESRNKAEAHEIKIDKPFLFYVRDVSEDVILAAGKIMEIPIEPEVSLNFE